MTNNIIMQIVYTPFKEQANGKSFDSVDTRTLSYSMLAGGLSIEAEEEAW